MFYTYFLTHTVNNKSHVMSIPWQYQVSIIADTGYYDERQHTILHVTHYYSWKKQINLICIKVYGLLGVIWKISGLASKNCLLTVHYSLIYPYLTNCAILHSWFYYIMRRLLHELLLRLVYDIVGCNNYLSYISCCQPFQAVTPKNNHIWTGDPNTQTSTWNCRSWQLHFLFRLKIESADPQV